MTADVDLSETGITLEDLEAAKKGWQEILRAFFPEWLKNGSGILSAMWNEPTRYNVCFTAEIYRLFVSLYSGLTPRRPNVVVDKFRKLLAWETRKEFEEDLIEIQVGDFLLMQGLPVEIEPEVLKSSGEQGRPDFAFHISNTRVFVEVTRWEYNVLKEWRIASDASLDVLSNHLGKARTGLYVAFTVSLEARSCPLDDNDAAQAAAIILSQPEGFITRKHPANAPIEIAWKQLPVFSNNGDSPKIHFTVTHTGFACTATSENTEPVMQVNLPVVTSEQLLLKAIRNRVDRKLKQFCLEEPFLLFMRLGDDELFPHHILESAAKRLWPNPYYRRLSGIILFKPREYSQTFKQFSGASNEKFFFGMPSWMCSLNPNASNPIPEELQEQLRPRI